jgi:hypothetical protein
MTNELAAAPPLQRLIDDDAIGQLRRRDGLIAALGTENGSLKLDWVEGIARLLADPTKLEDVEAEARDIRRRGIRHIIWSGMGGSVIAVRVLHDLGFCYGPNDPTPHEGTIAIHPLDSTDPAALNAILRDIATAKNLRLPASASPLRSKEAPSPVPPTDVEEQQFLRLLLHDVMMIGVSMGMTSEEPITHLTWFTDLLHRAHIQPADHLLVMTLPGSYLDTFAHQQHAPSRPLQLDNGTGTGGRMSAPTTRVFLLPAALYLTGLSAATGQLRSVLQRAWDEYNLDLATARPASHPFVQLAAALSNASFNDTCRMILKMPEGWRPLVQWIEQLMEESLGKGGKGVVVFGDQTLNEAAPGYDQRGLLHVQVVPDAAQTATAQHFILSQPSLASEEPFNRLAALATSFLGWQLSMALYGYLHRIQYAGQPAVENYKARAHTLRSQPDPLQVASNWHPALRSERLTLLAPHQIARSQPHHAETSQQRQPSSSPASAFASAVQAALPDRDTQTLAQAIALGYLDVTVNGAAGNALISALDKHTRSIGNELLGIPIKLRQAPAAYHSTEQSEMDGPSYLVSLRLVARSTEPPLIGTYTNAFLHAQAVSTWQAMMEVNRPCFLLVVEDSLDDALEPLTAFFSQVEHDLEHRGGLR